MTNWPQSSMKSGPQILSKTNGQTHHKNQLRSVVCDQNSEATTEEEEDFV